METLKILKALSIIILISISAGCSDSPSPVSSGITEKDFSGIDKITESSKNQNVKLPVIIPFERVIILKPNEEYTFNEGVTGYSGFTSIDIINLTRNAVTDRSTFECSNLFIYMNNKKELEISCHSNSLDVREITIQNLNPVTEELAVSLNGYKTKRVK